MPCRAVAAILSVHCRGQLSQELIWGVVAMAAGVTPGAVSSDKVVIIGPGMGGIAMGSS
jgi:hypothetical protein